MPIPTSKGQYRRVRYDDDGVYVYQCLWCLQTIRISDDPQYGWNFCPCCGKSWFRKLDCRDHEIPRWVYDRWGNNPPHDLQWYCKRVEPLAVWVFECRTKWFSDEWGEWKLEYDSEKDPCNPDYRWAKSTLEQFRLRHLPLDPEDSIRFEYRVRLVRKKNLTFYIHGVDFSNLSEEHKLIRNLQQKYGRKP